MNVCGRSLLLCAALFAAVCGSARADELVVNGGFETGDFTGWTVTNGDPSTDVEGAALVGSMYYSPHGGTFLAWFGTVTNDTAISQTFSDVVGAEYSLTFYLEGGSTSPSKSDFNVSIDGGSVLTLNELNFDSADYVKYTFQFTGTGSDTIQFAGSNDNDYFGLDDVSVSSTPEPSSVLLLGTGMVAMMGFGMRRRMTAAMAGR